MDNEFGQYKCRSAHLSRAQQIETDNVLAVACIIAGEGCGGETVSDYDITWLLYLLS